MKASIKNRNDTVLGGWVNFEAYSDEPVTEAQAGAEQRRLGYDPMGYGFYTFRCEHVGLAEGLYRATWRCQASCD